jgi:hypothetical protein
MTLQVITSEPVEENVIFILESTLEKARAGEYSAIAIATVGRDGVTGSGWSTIHSFGAMLGAISRLSHHVNRLADGD